MRYFIVFYQGYNNNGKKIDGNTIDQGDEFPNRKAVREYLKNVWNIFDPEITNIIELNETDFNNFIK